MRAPILALIMLAGCGAGGDAAFRERAREAIARDGASGAVAARSLAIEHRHEPHWNARLVALTWSIDGAEVGRSAWDAGAPALTQQIVDGQVPVGDHTITVEARYHLYTCCYACGFMQDVTLRTEHRVAIAEDTRLCFRTSGQESVLSPIEEWLPALPIACDAAD